MEMNKDTTLGELTGHLENLEGYVRGTMNKAKDALDKIHGLRMATYIKPEPEAEQPQPAPEPSAEERLGKAGGKIIRRSPYGEGLHNCGENEVEVWADGINLRLYLLTLDRAEAALRAARGESLCWLPDCESVNALQRQLAAANKEVERLTADVVKLEADVDEGDKCAIRDRDEIKRLMGEIAEAWDELVCHPNSIAWTPKRGNWLARNTPIARNRP